MLCVSCDLKNTKIKPLYDKFVFVNTINSSEFWNASLAYRKDKDAKKDKDTKLEYEIKATNLFNTKAQNNTSASAISVSAIEYLYNLYLYRLDCDMNCKNCMFLFCILNKL